MDRRRTLALAASLPTALATGRAAACSLAVDSAESFSARLPAVARLFQAWFARDEMAFLGAVLGPRNTNGIDPDAATLRRYIAASPDAETKSLYARLFADADRYRRIVSMTAVGDSVLVAVDESSPGGIGPDCSGMPTLRLFRVRWRNGRPDQIRLVEESAWSGHAQTAHWSV